MVDKGIKYILLAAVVLAAPSCVRENLAIDNKTVPQKLDLDKICAGSYVGDIAPVQADGEVISLSVVAPASSASTKANRDRSGKPSQYVCDVEIQGYKEGCNLMTLELSPVTKTIFDSNSSDSIACNFLRLDENTGSDHTALYAFPTWASAKVLEGEISGAPDNSGGKYRSVILRPEQKYNSYAPVASTDSIFYHSRMIGWHPMVCSLPQSGSPDVFGHSRYTNYLTLLSGKYGISFDHALDGSTDLLMSNLCEGQRWHSPTGAYIYRDLDKQLPETYSQPFGVNYDQEPHYSNAFSFKHYLTAVRIWAKLDQSNATSEQGILNISTWGKIEALTFVDQPSTCTIMFPEQLGTFQESVLEGSWTDYTNFEANPSYMFGTNDLGREITDQNVQYPIDMTKQLVGMDSTYLGYSLVMPGADIIVAIQTSAGTYQATLPHKVLVKGDSTEIFKEGMIYDIVLNLETKGQVSDFIENEDTGTYKDLSPWNNVNSEFETANCYMIDVSEVSSGMASDPDNLPGYCFLGTTMGNGDPGILQQGVTTFHSKTATISPYTAKLVWQSTAGMITNVHLQHGYVRFQVAKAVKGNAVIAVTNEQGDIIWSWHIWITDPVNYITPPDSCNNSYYYMDRNLGAIASASKAVAPTTDQEAVNLYGLYYQWGRKDPLPGPLKYNQTGGHSMRITPVFNAYNEEINSLGMYIYNQGETVEDGIRRPMHYLLCHNAPYYNFNWMSSKIDFLWGWEQETSNGDVVYNKSIYDPCPYGYHVPGEEIQFLAKNARVRKFDNTYGQSLDGIFFPYAGFYGPDRNQTANDAGANYCGSKGDYQGAMICSEEDGSDYSYFRYHRLRTYLSKATAWTEQNVDGQTSFEYKAAQHYVKTTVVDTEQDYANRNTAAPIRCIKTTDFKLNVTTALTLSTQQTSVDYDTPIKFYVDGTTNKGVIKSAVLDIYYTKNSNGSAVKYSYNLADYPTTATITSKILYGYVDVTIPQTWVNDAKNNEIYSRLTLTVTQGGTDHIENSTVYEMLPGFSLSILVNDSGTGATAVLDKAYCVDATDTQTIDGSTQVTFNTTRLVNHNGFYPAVKGQGTTVTVYVNSPTATVTIGGNTATYNGTSKTLDGRTFYAYSVSGLKWDGSAGWHATEISASEGTYKTKYATVNVPVYAVSYSESSVMQTTGSKRNAVTEADGIKKNWYLFNAAYGLPVTTGGQDNAFLYFNGKHFHDDLTSDNIDYRYLMGFEKTTNSTKIYNAVAGTSKPWTGSSSNATIQCGEGTSYNLVDYTVNNWLSPINGRKYIRIRYGSSYDVMRTIGHDEYFLNNNNYYLSHPQFWFYPVTFVLP